MKQINELKWGAILSYVSIFLTTTLGLIITPFMIRKLGESEYGLYNLIGAFVGYLTLLNFGLNHTIIRFVAKYKAEKNKEKEHHFITNALYIYSFLSIIIIITGIGLYTKIDNIFSKSLTVNELKEAKIMFIILIFNLSLTLPRGIFTGISNGYEKFIFLKATNIIKYLLRTVLLLMILFLGTKALGIVILDTVMNIIILLANMYFVVFILKVSLFKGSVSKKTIKTIFSYSIWIFIFALVAQFQWKVGQMVLGIKMNTTAVAVYAIGIMLGTYYGAFSTAITSMFLPRATQMIVNKATPKELTDMMIKVGRISLFILLYILIAFLLYGKMFIKLWVGDNYYEAWWVALITMIAYTIPLVQNFGNSVLEAKKLLTFKALLYLFFLIGGSIAGMFLIDQFGIIGMILGTAIGWILAQLIMNIYYKMKIKIEIIRFFKELLNKTLVVAIFVTLISAGLNFIKIESWGIFLLKSILYTIIYFTLMYKFALNKNEKKLITDSLLNLKKRMHI